MDCTLKKNRNKKACKKATNCNLKANEGKAVCKNDSRKYYLVAGDGMSGLVLHRYEKKPNTTEIKKLKKEYDSEGRDYAILGFSKRDVREGQVNLSQLNAPFVKDIK